MKKTTIIRRLQATRRKMDTLKPRQFNYGNYVTTYKTNADGTICSTVCCVAGWYHKWFPKVGVVTREYIEGITLGNADRIMWYHGIKLPLYRALFMGEGIFTASKYLWRIDTHASLNEVKRHWDDVIQLIKDGELDQYLFLA